METTDSWLLSSIVEVHLNLAIFFCRIIHRVLSPGVVCVGRRVLYLSTLCVLDNYTIFIQAVSGRRKVEEADLLIRSGGEKIARLLECVSISPRGFPLTSRANSATAFAMFINKWLHESHVTTWEWLFVGFDSQTKINNKWISLFS